MTSDKIDVPKLGSEEEAATESQEPEEAAATALTSLGSAAPEGDGEVDGKGLEIPQRFTKSGRKRAVPFPLKLMKALSNKNFSHAITWMPSGKSFSIVKPKAFVAEILPDHFKSAKYSSFTRKLHRWGFMRHYRGEDAGAFYHKDFQKDRLDLVEEMTCHKVESPKAPVSKKTTSKATSEPAATPAVPPQPVQRLVPRPATAQQPMPIKQPAEIVAQLQQQQQQLKAPELGAAERLNAAIEAEVTRRLKERIQHAAMSRHALAVMQQQLNPPTPARQQWNLAAGSLQARLIQMQQQKQQLGMDPSCVAFTGFRRQPKGLGELPHTNIQGAKTA